MDKGQSVLFSDSTFLGGRVLLPPHVRPPPFPVGSPLPSPPPLRRKREKWLAQKINRCWAGTSTYLLLILLEVDGVDLRTGNSALASTPTRLSPISHARRSRRAAAVPAPAKPGARKPGRMSGGVSGWSPTLYGRPSSSRRIDTYSAALAARLSTRGPKAGREGGGGGGRNLL